MNVTGRQTDEQTPHDDIGRANASHRATKTRLVWLPDGDKTLKISLFFSTESMNVTDGQTPHDGIGRACIASRGKNS